MSVNTPDWVKDAVFYQIFPDRFAKSDRVHKAANLQEWGATPTFNGFQGGDLLGVVEHLDHLVELGVNAIYFNPVFMSGSNHRYHTFDYFRIDPMLGDDDVFQELLDAAHERGIRVILDGVFNHASRGFFQFNLALEAGPDSPYTDWFHFHNWPTNAYNEGEAANYHAWWGLHALPKFNTDTPAVREYLWSAAEYWLKKGIDGWRLDVPNEIDDDEFWREFRRRCLAINKDCYIVGELWHDSQRWLQGDQFDAIMNYVFTRAAFGYLVGDDMDQSDTHRTGLGHMATINGHNFLGEMERINNHTYHPEIVLAQMNMLGSHDTPRMGTVAGEDKQAIRLLMLCMMTMPGAPNIYYGDEIGMMGGHDPYCRGAFPWDDEEKWDKALFADIKKYTQMRHECVALRRGSFVSLYADDNVVAYGRQHGDETCVIVFNNAKEARTATIPLPQRAPDQLTELLVEEGETLTADTEITLPAKSGRVWVGRC